MDASFNVKITPHWSYRSCSTHWKSDHKICVCVCINMIGIMYKVYTKLHKWTNTSSEIYIFLNFGFSNNFKVGEKFQG